MMIADNAAPPKVSRLRQTGIVIPTYNAGGYWERLQSALEQQGLSKDQILIVDSSSSDNTRDMVQRAGYRLKKIPTESFRHGATRQMAFESLPWADQLVYLTQDALPSQENSIEELLAAFDDPNVGAAYGRQLPRDEADPIERHARIFNYPDVSDVRDLDSRKRLGFKAAFFSNSFAAYRRTALEEVGGFPKNTIVSEEVTVAARMLMAGWRVAYQADATVIHSHPLSMRQEFSRYFDIGVHHGRERWLLDEFGGAEGEGRNFVASQMRFLMNARPALIPVALIRNMSKFVSYHLGRNEAYLPETLKEALSAQPNFWRDKPAPTHPTQQSSHVAARIS
jgi:rhamnosyltransferase